MKATKRKKLERAGWAVGSASDFLGLSEAEVVIVGMKLALASKLRTLRQQQKLTQEEVAKRIGSSQSRVAKMEVAERSVSIELLVRSLISLGASPGQIGKIIGAGSVQKKRTPAKVAELAKR